MWALTNVPALPLHRRRDHAFVLGAVASSTIAVVGADPADATLLSCQGRMSTCYLLPGGQKAAVVKIRPSDRISLSPGNQKAVALQRYIADVIATPETYSFGVVTHPSSGITYEYIVEEHLPFTPPKVLSTKQRIRMYKSLALAMRGVHRVKVAGFGDSMYHGETRFLASTWKEWVTELLFRCKFRELASAGLLTMGTASHAEEIVRSLSGLNREPELYHGDVLGNWANFLIDEKLTIRAFLDWEFAGSGAAVENELASVLYCFVRDAVPIAEQEIYLQALLDGLGISREQFISVHRPVIEALLLVHAAKAIYRIFPGAAVWSAERAEREQRIIFARRARALIESIVRIS